MACLRNLSSHDLIALDVYLKAKELAALGGTDYTAQLGNGGTLAQAAACIKNQLTPYQRNLALITIDAENAIDSGATIPSAQADLIDAIKCLKDFDSTTLKAMNVYITCLLGRHAPWPQVNRQ